MTPYRRIAHGATDPRTVPALKAGGIWIPGEGYTSTGNGSHAWASQSANTGPGYDFHDDHDGYKPALSMAENGASVWDMPAGGPTASWVISTPGPALCWTSKGSYAGWFKADQLDYTIHYFFANWPGGATGNRMLCHKNDDPNRIAIYTSYDGSAYDASPPVPPSIGHRAKWNSAWGPGLGALIDWSEWHFLRLTYDMSRNNYEIGGVNFSNRLRVFVDEEEIAADPASGAGAFSAPQPQLGGAPPDGPVRGIFGGPDVGRFSLGADFVSGQWPGQIGPFYIANGDEGLTDAVWRRVMAYGAPA